MLAILVLFFSGAAALVYQTLWVKQLALVVGGDVYAVTIALAAFFAGLALGAAVLGRRARPHPVIASCAMRPDSARRRTSFNCTLRWEANTCGAPGGCRSSAAGATPAGSRHRWCVWFPEPVGDAL